MPKLDRNFTVSDPRNFDGNPFEVADRAFTQAAAVAEVLLATITGARIMARNSEMERQLMATGECSAADFEKSPQAVKIDSLVASAEALQRTLSAVGRAASYNPKKPPKEL